MQFSKNQIFFPTHWQHDELGLVKPNRQKIRNSYKRNLLVTLTVPEDSHSIRSSLAGTSVASHGSSETMSLEDNNIHLRTANMLQNTPQREMLLGTWRQLPPASVAAQAAAENRQTLTTATSAGLAVAGATEASPTSSPRATPTPPPVPPRSPLSLGWLAKQKAAANRSGIT